MKKVVGVIFVVIILLLVIAILKRLKPASWTSERQGAPFTLTDPAYVRGNPVPLTGTDEDGTTYGQPADWPAAAGAWNAKGAHYNAAIGNLVFETYRADITGGSVTPKKGTIQAAGVTDYFEAGPHTGSTAKTGTTVLYISDRNGGDPTCIGCADVTDGVNGVRIFSVVPSASHVANTPIRKIGFTIYANQNKDLASWYPDGSWLIASVEMPTHALTHSLGNAEIGMFNDLWAISADGKTWVQLTDFSATWQFADDVAKMPFLCADVKNCSLGCQYVATTEYPYDAYSCSAKNQPPPAMGLMRPVVGNAAGGALVPIAFGERVGLSADYTWGGPLQLAMADMAFVDQLPALIDYRTNLTPTPRDPAGDTLWSNPGGDTTIGTGYEPWAFSAGNVSLGIASDAFQKTTAPTSAAFTDVLTWQWQGTPSLKDVTAFGPRYPYAPNGAPTPINTYGQWEEPMVYSLGANPAFIAFGSSADLNPPWNPLRHASTFGLETWILRTDGSAAPAIKLTHLNDGKGGNKLAYPTAYDPGDNSLYLSVVPAGGTGGANPAGIVYKIKVPEF